MSWTEQKQQWVEAAARTMWVCAWSDAEDLRCDLCPFDGNRMHDGSSIEGAHELWLLETDREVHTLTPRTHPWLEALDIAPPTPLYAKLAAAELLGMIEQANGCDLSEIIYAAFDAERERCKLSVHTGAGCTYCTVNVAEFGSACAMMAMGTGVSWFDNHEKFSIPATPLNVQCMADVVLGTVPFIVPSYEFTYEGAEVANVLPNRR